MIKKILHVNTMDLGGGAAKVAYQLNNHINSLFEDYSSTLLVGRKKIKDASGIISCNDEAWRLYSNVLLTRLTGLDGMSILMKKNKIIELINSFDILNFHNLHGYYFPIKILKKIDKNSKKIWTFHDMWPITGRCSYSYDCDKWMTGCHKCAYKSEYPKAYIDVSSLLYKQKMEIFSSLENLSIITPSRWLYGIVKKSFLKQKVIKHIPNGVDIKIYSEKDKEKTRKRYNFPLDKKIILFSAADLNDRRKGFKYLIQAMNSLKYKKDYILISVGKKLTNNIFDNELRVEQMGYISDDFILADLYSLSDLYVTTSLADNLPCTIQESMACGTPIIGFDVGGISELVINNYTGLTVKVSNTNALNNAIYSLLNDKYVLEKFSKNCINEVKEKYVLDDVVEKYISLYNGNS